MHSSQSMLRITKKTMTGLILLAALSVMTSAAGINAYLTASDTATNTFTIGNVSIELLEDHWDPSQAAGMRPGKELAKDPRVVNTGNNSCFVFLDIEIPKKEIYTYNSGEGQDPADPNAHAREPLAVTELFSLPDANSGWTLADTDDSAEDKTVYRYAYGSPSQMTVLGSGASTPTLFDKVKYCYAVEGQGLDTDTITINVRAYAIQTGDITGSDASDPETILNIIEREVQ